MKKILGLIPLLGLLLVLTCAPASALSDGEYEYTLQNNEVRLDKYIGSGGDVTIPTTIRGIPVTVIGDRCFAYTDDVTSIYVPGTVREIGVQAFAQTDQAPTLKKVVIAEGVSKIKDMAFIHATGLTDVQLPSSLASSLSQAKVVFSGCTSLPHITLPYGMTAITYHMFEGCDNLRSVSLPATIQTIGEYAFYECDLRSVEIPRDTQFIDEFAFSRNMNLQKLTFAGNKLTEIEDGAFKTTDLQGVLLLPTSLKTLGTHVFTESDGLTGAALPYGFTKIAGTAPFYQCVNLQWVTVPSTVNNILGSSGDIIKECPNAIVYCPAGSFAEKMCQKKGNSYLTDPSADTTIPVLYNGQRISFGSYGQNPTIINSRTMGPLRSIFEAMGADVSWDNDTRTARGERNGTTVSIAIGSNVLYVNGRAVGLDSPACIINNRTMVPVRAIAEAFQATVDWDNPSRTVIIAE